MIVLEKPTFIASSSLNNEEVTSFIETMASVLNQKDSHITSRVNENSWRNFTQIIYEKGDDIVHLDLSNWGASYRGETHDGLSIKFGKYDKQRIMFKNPNRFFTIVDKIVAHLKGELEDKLQSQINCNEQIVRNYQRQSQERKEVIKTLGIDPKSIPSYNTLQHFEVRTADRTKSLTINLEDNDHTKSSIKTQDIDIVKRLLELTDADVHFSVVVNGNGKTLKKAVDAVFNGEDIQV